MENKGVGFGSFREAIRGKQPIENFRILRRALEISRLKVQIEEYDSFYPRKSLYPGKRIPPYVKPYVQIKVSHSNPRTEAKIQHAINVITEDGKGALAVVYKMLRIPKRIQREALKPEVTEIEKMLQKIRNPEKIVNA